MKKILIYWDKFVIRYFVRRRGRQSRCLAVFEKVYSDANTSLSCPLVDEESVLCKGAD